MATLHLINKSPAGSDALEACLGVIAADDAVLLIEDGVYAGLAGSATSRVLAGVGSALIADLEARGVQGRLAEGIDSVDDHGFVELCIRCDRVMSWF